MKLTDEQLNALDDHIAALQAWRDDPTVKLQWRYALAWNWASPEHAPITSEFTGLITNGWYRIKQAPQSRPMTWEEIPLGEIWHVRYIGGGSALPIQEVDISGHKLLIDGCQRGIRCLSEKFEFTTCSDPRNATWKRFEVTE